MDIWAASTLGAVRHDAAINIPAQVLCGCVFVCLGSGVAGSCDNSVFSLLRNYQIALLVSTILHLQWMKVPVFNYFLSRLSGSV